MHGVGKKVPVTCVDRNLRLHFICRMPVFLKVNFTSLAPFSDRPFNLNGEGGAMVFFGGGGGICSAT